MVSPEASRGGCPRCESQRLHASSDLQITQEHLRKLEKLYEEVSLAARLRDRRSAQLAARLTEVQHEIEALSCSGRAEEAESFFKAIEDLTQIGVSFEAPSLASDSNAEALTHVVDQLHTVQQENFKLELELIRVRKAAAEDSGLCDSTCVLV